MTRLLLTLVLLVAFSAHSYCYTVAPVNVTAYLDNYYSFLMVDDDLSEFNIYVNHNEKLESIDQAVYTSSQIVPSAEEGWEIVVRWVAKPIKVGDVLNYIVTVKKDGEVYSSGPRSFKVKDLVSPISRRIPKLILHW